MPSDNARPERIGIYGGTFGPVHFGHLRAAKAFLSACELDLLYLMPAGIPPHKALSGSDTPKDRLVMLELAFSDPLYSDPKIRISDHELTRPGKSYTVLTLEHFRAENRKLYLLCGTDMFLTLSGWYRSADIFASAAIVCFLRGAEDTERPAVEETAERYRKRYNAEILLPPFEPLPLSSTEVRRAVAAGEPTDAMLPGSVRDYIDRHGLYR